MERDAPEYDEIVLHKRIWDTVLGIVGSSILFIIEYLRRGWSFNDPISILLTLFCIIAILCSFLTIRITKDHVSIAIGSVAVRSVAKERIAHTQVIRYQLKEMVVFVLDNCPKYSVESNLSLSKYINMHLLRVFTYTIPPKQYDKVISLLGKAFSLEFLIV